MLTVLMIDDDPAVIETVRNRMTEVNPAIVFHKSESFTSGLALLKDVKPDVLILDWFRGDPATGEAAGGSVWSSVWAEWFCPIIIYSAGDVEFPEKPPDNHPFIRVLAKGMGSERSVAEHILSYSPHATALRDSSDEILRVMRSVLRHIAPALFTLESNDEVRRDVLLRAARRRAAAMMDDATCFGGQIAHAWEMYVFPVLTKHPITGDILRVANGNADSPISYRVVLTPTCDMVPHGAAGACKVTYVLAARCCPATQFAEKGMNLARGTAVSKVKDRLEAALNESHQSGFVLLPECPGTIPTMAVNLRDLDLIAVANIGNELSDGKEYVRIASLDSPFREQFVWAYMQIGCRLGLPPRSMQSLVDSFAALWTQQATDG